MDVTVAVFYGAGIIITLLLLEALSGPLSVVAKVFANSLAGGMALVLVNVAFGWAGLAIGVNPFTAVIAGMLGVPGVVALAVIRAIVV